VARPVAIITGASAGIGTALARVFADHGHELVLIARREDRLRELAQEIAARNRPRPLVLGLDLTRPGASERVAAALAVTDLEPQYVVNNAGFGLWGASAQLSRDKQLAMVDLNVRTLVDLSLAFVDSLARHRGGILNVASVAAFLPGPYMTVYYASKAFVLSFSEALRAELRPRDVRVTTLCPGPVPTEFQARAGGVPHSEGNRWLTRSAEQVALAGYRGLMAGKAVVVPGLANRIITFLPRLVPRTLLADQMGRMQAR
jgi:short-subunit dehydrogenase